MSLEGWERLDAESDSMTGRRAAWGGARECIPQGLKPLFFLRGERAKPEGLAYLEATTWS